MHTKRLAARILGGLAIIVSATVLSPEAASAQSAIAGLVRDSSGAVLPGVLVEASSDVLIEKVRSSISDVNGQYRIVDLRPGVYTVTFTLTGFNTVKREAVEVPTDFVAGDDHGDR
jgi:hypothetical protein